MEEILRIQVKVKSVLFENGKDGFAVVKVINEKTEKEFTASGRIGSVHEDEVLILCGRFEQHPKYGEGFKVQSMELPDLRQGGMKGFLASGYLKGVGPALGKRIYEHFGEGSARVFDEEPERLLEVKGVGRSKLDDIMERWGELRHKREALGKFAQWGISANLSRKIFERWPNVRDALQAIENDPYVLAWEIRGVGFRMADKIARDYGIPANSQKRIQAAIGYVLDNEALGNGHCFLPKPELLQKVSQFLDPSHQGFNPAWFPAIENALSSLVFEQRVELEAVAGGERYYLKPIFLCEMAVARHVRRLMSLGLPQDMEKVRAAIGAFEAKHNFPLHETQREAVLQACTQKISVITGGPGTGKTTIIRCILHVCNKLRVRQVKLAAPTGKAAQRMAESTGKNASTIHRLLGFGASAESHNEENPLSCGMLIVDETSMLDIYLSKHLLSALPDGARLILVGDVDQLPSVSAGAVLKDLIGCGRIPVVRLSEVYRQSKDSFINLNAKAVLEGRGKDLRFNGAATDFKIMAIPTHEHDREGHLVREFGGSERTRFAAGALRNCVLRLLELGRTPDEIMVLSPTKTGEVGVTKVNLMLQDLYNAQGTPISGTAFRVGDRVLQTKNNYTKDVFNGDQGVICDYDSKEKELTVRYESGLVKYSMSEVRELTLAYCITVHKAQGMESPCVVQVVSLSQFVMLTRNILYTGITRAKEFCVLIGEHKAINMALAEYRILKRHTSLGERVADAIPAGMHNYRTGCGGSGSHQAAHMETATGREVSSGCP